MKIINTAIVYHYIAHYRRPIFDSLYQSLQPSYFLISDVVSNVESIKLISPDEYSDVNSKWIKIENKWISKDILWQKGLIKLFFSNKFDSFILLGNMYFISTWVVLILAKLTKKKVYLWTHGFRKYERGLKGRIRYLFYSLSDGLFLYGNRAKDILIDMGFDKDKLHVLYNSLDYEMQMKIVARIDDEVLSNMRKSIGACDDEKIIIATGRITKDKRFDLLIDALKILSSKGSYKLIIVGDGPDKNLVEEKALSLGLKDKVIFYGSCYDEVELATLLVMSNVSVVPGDIGLSAIHSLTYGTPVVTHNNFDRHKPEFEAIQNDVNGSFYTYGSIDNLADKIELWCSKNKATIKDDCQRIVSNYYNPSFQKSVIDSVILADD